MSTNSNSTYLPKMIRLAAQAGTTGSLRASLLGSMLRWPRWWAHARKEKADPIITADFMLGNERFAEGGYYRISPEQMSRERAIDVHSLGVNLIRGR